MKTLRIRTILVDAENGEVLREDVSDSASSWPTVEALRRARKVAGDTTPDCRLFEFIPDGFRRLETRDGMPGTLVVQEVTLS